LTLFYKIIAIFLILYCFMLGVIIFGSVRFLSKKSNQIEIIFFWKKNRNRTETGSNRPVSVRFGFLGKKPVQIGLARFFRFWLGFFQFWLGFFWFGSVFPVWLGFGSIFFSGFLSVSVRFGFFRFFVYKIETEPAGFLKNLIGFFFGSIFSVIFFLIFSV
jgi:hypothetical protein